MKHIKGLLAVSVLFLLSLLPLAWAQRLGAALGRKMARGESKLARITRKNIEICFPELDSTQRDVLALNSIEQTGCSAGEMGMSWMWKPERVLEKISEVHNEDVLADALAQKRGVIIVAPHLGNWEVLGLYLSNKYKMTTMYRPPKIEMMDRLTRKKRERLGAQLAPANVKGVRMTMKALKSGGLVGILPDQEADPGSGVYVPFFGIDAYTMKLLPQLAAQTGAVVVTAFAKRLPRGEGFEIYFNKADAAIGSKDIEVSARAMNAEVESCVRQIPEQYQWEYRRFDCRPEGEPKIY